jgi:hypothetical protein
MSNIEPATYDDPWSMMHDLRPYGTDRKLRLYAVACARRVSHLMTDRRSRSALDVAERFADGMATEEERHLAWEAAQAVSESKRGLDGWPALAAVATLVKVHPGRSWAQRAARAAQAAAFAVAVSKGVSPTIFPSDQVLPDYVLMTRWTERSPLWIAREVLEEESRQAELIRDIFPPVELRSEAPTCAAISTGLRNNALSIYESQNFEHLRQLATLLVDEGFPDDRLVAHCSGAVAHVRGCWALDLLLQKS